MWNRLFVARIASIFLILHALIEMAGLVLINSIPFVLVSFGGLTGSALERNAWAIAMFGALWGVSRLVAASGVWFLQKWALMLGIILSTITMIAAITIIPAGVTDTLLSIPILTLLLFAWYGNERKEIV